MTLYKVMWLKVFSYPDINIFNITVYISERNMIDINIVYGIYRNQFFFFDTVSYLVAKLILSLCNKLGFRWFICSLWLNVSFKTASFRYDFHFQNFTFFPSPSSSKGKEKIDKNSRCLSSWLVMRCPWHLHPVSGFV